MNESIVVPQKEQENTERHKNLIIVLTVLTTVFAAALAALQADAGIRANIANRESQYLAVLASGELHRAGLEGNYQFNIFGDYLKNLQETTVLELTALQQEKKGDTKAAQSSRELAASSQARADVGTKFSIFYNDARYAPKSEEDLPKAEQYVTDLNQKANDTVAKQNEASDAYRRWNQKSDTYVTALTILAVAFFLFSLAQALKDVRTRLTFTVLGVIVVGISLAITLLTLIA